jgi:hypothetical protein
MGMFCLYSLFLAGFHPLARDLPANFATFICGYEHSIVGNKERPT